MATGKPRIEIWENGGASTLNGAINDSVTSLVVTSAASFPAGGDFKIAINSEILNVTAVATNTFTVERGADGTTAASHSSSDAVTHYLTGESLDQAYIDNHGGDNTNGFPYNRIEAAGVTKVASDFTWLNQGSATAATADDGGIIMTAGASEALDQLRGKHMTAPSTPWLVAAYIHLGNGMAIYNGAGAGTVGGIFMREASSGELYNLFLRSDRIAMWRMTSVTAFSAEVDTYIANGAEEIWLRMGDDGVDVTGEVSMNGWDWEECFNEGRTSFMAGGPDQIGFHMMNGNGDASAEVYLKSWIQY